MRVAVIGLGGIARKAFLPVLTSRPGIELILSSRSDGSVRQAQAEYRIALAALSLEDVVRHRPRAAFVLTPKATHYQIVRVLLEAGIDVFVEKPAALRAGEVQELADEADARSCVLMVGFNRRFAPLHVRARELLSGQPVSLALFTKHRTGSAATTLVDHYLEDTVHQIDLLRYYCGEGEAISTLQYVEAGRLSSTVSTVALQTGGIATIATSLQAGAWGETYALHASGRSILVDAFSRVRLATPDGEQAWTESYASSWRTTLEGRGIQPEIEHFFECVETRAQPLTSARDAVKTQQLVEQLTRIARPANEHGDVDSARAD